MHGRVHVHRAVLVYMPKSGAEPRSRISIRGIQRLQRRVGGLCSARQIAGHCGAETAKEQYERSLRREANTFKLCCV